MQFDFDAWTAQMEVDDEDEEADEAEERKERRERLERAKKLQIKRAEAAMRRRSGPRGAKRRPLTFFSWRDHEHRLTDPRFKLRYRVTRESFHKLHADLKAHIETKNLTQAKRTRLGGAVDSRVRLAVALRYLAGGAICDLALIYHISETQCRSSLWRVIDAIHAHSDFDINADWVNDPDALRELEHDFAEAHRRRYGSRSWRGQVGAIDGCDFTMRNPGKAVPNPRRFFVERKGHYEMLCTAICDSRRRFIYYDMSFEACTHDSLAWSGSPLGGRIDALLKQHDQGYFLNGDNAYVLSNTMIVPGGGDDFDFYQSSNRMAIECSFGMLIRRWGVFWRPLEVKMSRRVSLIGAAMKLHNFCINENIGLELRSVGKLTEINPRVWAPTPDFGPNGEPRFHLDTSNENPPSCLYSSRDSRRKDLAGEIKSAGLKRPGTSSFTRQARRRSSLPLL